MVTFTISYREWYKFPSNIKPMKNLYIFMTAILMVSFTAQQPSTKNINHLNDAQYRIISKYERILAGYTSNHRPISFGRDEILIGSSEAMYKPVNKYAIPYIHGDIAATLLKPCDNGLISDLEDPDRKTVEPEIDTIFLPGQVPLKMVRISPGLFQMGTPDSEPDFEPDESPLHLVNISYDFYLGITEVTQVQWVALMGNWPNEAPADTFGRGPDYPAYFITWYDCKKFLATLNAYIQKTGQGAATFRLPSEAEWEYSCRAGTETRFFFGYDQKLADDYIWSKENSTAIGSKPVAGKKANPWGLYDMSGNVWEWCEDYYHPNYEGAPTDGSAWTQPKHEFVILRSGDTGLSAAKCRCANRNDHRKPEDRSEDIGFRLVRTK